MRNTDNLMSREKLTLTDNIVANSKLLIKLCKDNNILEAKQLLYGQFINLELQDESGCTAFHYACIHEDRALLDLLLNKYICPHLMEEYIYHEGEHFICFQEKNDNKTILHYISEKNLIEFYNKLEIYFPHKVHKVINYLTHDGSTALHFACEKASNQILEKIIQIPTLNINQIDHHQNTALHIACQYNHLPIVKILLLHPQINVNIKNNTGDTPLHIACKSNYYGIILIVKELLKMRSVNIFLKNNQHLSPLELAAEHNHYEIEALLKCIEKSSLNEVDHENRMH